MAKSGGQPGNKNATLEKRAWGNALNRSLVQGDRLRRAADALVDKAIDGDVAALKEIGDRVDGKVPQGIVGADGGPVQVQDVPWLRGRAV